MNDAPPRLYAHPFSSYCQKVLVALYEHGTPFEYRHLEHDGNGAELAALWHPRCWRAGSNSTRMAKATF